MLSPTANAWERVIVPVLQCTQLAIEVECHSKSVAAHMLRTEATMRMKPNVKEPRSDGRQTTMFAHKEEETLSPPD